MKCQTSSPAAVWMEDQTAKTRMKQNQVILIWNYLIYVLLELFEILQAWVPQLAMNQAFDKTTKWLKDYIFPGEKIYFRNKNFWAIYSLFCAKHITLGVKTESC